MIKKVLFVCTGNTCRSPLAEVVFNRLIQRNRLTEEFQGISAGTSVKAGFSASPSSIRVAARDGLDLTRHESQPVTRSLVEEVYLILAMTKEHKQFLIARFPGAEEKVFTIKEFIEEQGDIEDPIGLDEEMYHNVFLEIKKSVQEVYQRLQ